MIRIFFLLLIVFATPAMAQDFTGREATDYASGSEYKSLVYDALEMKPDFDFSYFRVLYSSLQNYDPLSENLQREMLALASTIKVEPLSDKRVDALERYTNLTLQNLANIDVVVMALSLSEEDKKFGNPEFFKWMYKGLLESVMRSGTGTSLNRAFKVVTLGEESALLSRLGFKIMGTQPGHEGSVYYNMHRVQDPKAKQIYTVFVDTTIPMTFLEEQDVRQNTISSVPDLTSGQTE